MTEREQEGGCQIHNSPLPIYHFAYSQGEYMPCVKLKDGHKALISRDGRINKGAQV